MTHAIQARLTCRAGICERLLKKRGERSNLTWTWSLMGGSAVKAPKLSALLQQLLTSFQINNSVRTF